MGRRSSKAGHGTGAVPSYDTVGMTILPGHPLPDWAAPEQSSTDIVGADDQAFATEAAASPEMAEPFDAAAAAAATSAAAGERDAGAMEHDLSRSLVGAGVGAVAATHSANVGADPAGLGAGYPGAGYSGAGYSGAGYGPTAGTVGTAAPTTAGHPTAGYAGGSSLPGASPAGYGPAGPGAGYGASPGYPAAPGYGTATASAGVSAPPAPASPFAPPAPRMPEPPVGVAAAAGAGLATAAVSTPAAPTGAAVPGAGQQTMGLGNHGGAVPPAGAGGHMSSSDWPADHGHGAATATLEAPAAPAAQPASTAAPSGAPTTDHPAPATPSQGWTSPDRPELSPEHVALLTWWAEMIAKGQFPAPTGAPGAPPAPPARESRRRRSRRHAPAANDATPAALAEPPTEKPRAASDTAKQPASGSRHRTTLVLVGLGGIAAIGLAVAFGPSVVSALTEEPAPVPASNLTMPTSVGDLVAVSSPDVSEQLQSMLGLGLRPAGITTTAGYGTDPASPVVLAGLATTTPAEGDAAQQITNWATRMNATVGEPVAGTSGTGGVTCAPVTAIPTALPGSFCVWTGSDRRGQSYVVGATTDVALQQTALLREGVVAAG